MFSYVANYGDDKWTMYSFSCVKTTFIEIECLSGQSEYNIVLA